MQFADTTGNQVGILGSEIQDGDLGSEDIALKLMGEKKIDRIRRRIDYLLSFVQRENLPSQVTQLSGLFQVFLGHISCVLWR